MKERSRRRNAVVVPVLIITLGVGWLLTTKAMMPGVDWVWVLGLGVVGFLVLAVGGFDKITIVIGPFLIISSILSILRQTGKLSIDTEIPLLTILIGALMLLSVLTKLPQPRWLMRVDEDDA
ncbi:MAG: hypothetical protein OEZ54_10565 [Gemmatimonadota bacterium]|nr:hypothetical protein [Gemmatimonadota bacterium]